MSILKKVVNAVSKAAKKLKNIIGKRQGEPEQTIEFTPEQAIEPIPETRLEDFGAQEVQTQPAISDLDRQIQAFQMSGYTSQELKNLEYNIQDLQENYPEKEKALEIQKKKMVVEYDRILSLLDESNESRITLEDRLGKKLSNQQYIDFVDVVNTEVWQRINEIVGLDSEQLVGLLQSNLTADDIVDTLSVFLDNNQQTTSITKEDLIEYIKFNIG